MRVSNSLNSDQVRQSVGHALVILTQPVCKDCQQTTLVNRVNQPKPSTLFAGHWQAV